jgi:hypothetical protein
VDFPPHHHSYPRGKRIAVCFKIFQFHDCNSHFMLLYRHHVTATDSKELSFTLLSTSWLAIPTMPTYFATILKYGIKIRQTQTESHIKLLLHWTKLVWEKFVVNSFTISVMTMVRQWILHMAQTYTTADGSDLNSFVFYFRIIAATQTTELLVDWLTTNYKQFGIGHGWIKVLYGHLPGMTKENDDKP